MPSVNMGGGESGTSSRQDPRAIAPITQAERTAYSVEERINRLGIQAAAENGTSARIIRSPRNAQIELVRSEGNA
jgi:hypothetical protein